MFESIGQNMNVMNVSKNNIENGPLLLLQHGFRVKSSDLGGNRYRKVYLELWNGDVWVQKG
jgi:chemotaxis protein CheD